MTGDWTRDHRLSLLARPHSPAFGRRVVVLPAGGVHPIEPAEWIDALIEVASGDIGVELTDGRWMRFAAGDVLWLHGLPVRAVHNRGAHSAVLVALRRRRPSPER